ncbi:MAG: hypothetical protein CFH08_00093 [Alphaproteobacteria bacterium MarineAlpha3_Bin7]|nr:MAG: hypothetical protein CFH08_00093 [Alphaproteobacteria bacterium MarineAlpha3_Bin7]|tara:strand:- start:672 stop:914 length:243 start_codon:yes stop_codon:yes gene_type:complete
MTDVGGISSDLLQSFVTRIENLEEEKAVLMADIREVYSEAKAMGFDGKTIRHLISLRKLDGADREQQEALLDLYKRALGM